MAKKPTVVVTRNYKYVNKGLITSPSNNEHHSKLYDG